MYNRHEMLDVVMIDGKARGIIAKNLLKFSLYFTRSPFFLHFCKFVQNVLLQPEEILETEDFSRDIAPRLKRIVSGDGYKRTDLLNTICTRMLLHLTSKHYRYDEMHKKNLIEFLLNKER